MRTAKTEREKRLDDPSRLPISVDDIAAGDDADASHATSPTMAVKS